MIQMQIQYFPFFITFFFISCTGYPIWNGYSSHHLLLFFILEPLGLPLKYDLTEKTITCSVCVYRDKERARQKERNES